MSQIIEPKKEERLVNFKDYLQPDVIFKIGAFLTVITYIFGCLIVTLHLSKYGITSFEILRLQYLMTGFWFFIPLVFAVILPFLTIYTYKFFNKSIKTNVMWFNKPTPIVMTLSLIIGFCAIIYLPMKEFSIILLCKFLLIPLILLFLVSIILWLVQKYKGSRNWIIYYVYIVLAILFIILQLPIFIDDIYPEIQRSLGGGKPSNVIIVPCNSFTIENFFLNKEKNSKESISGKLLLETNNQVVILPYNSTKTAISINKDQITAIIYNP